MYTVGWAVFFKYKNLTCLRVKSSLNLSGRQKKIVQFLPKFHQFCIDVCGIQIRWNFGEIFFRFKDRAFYLVFDFF